MFRPVLCFGYLAVVIKNLSILLYLNLPSGDELFGSIMRVCSRRHLSGNSTKFQEVGGNYDHLFGEVIPRWKNRRENHGWQEGKKVIGL